MAAGFTDADEALQEIAEMVFTEVRRAAPPGTILDIGLDSVLDEIGLDSLTRMEVLNAIEGKYHVHFTENSLFEIETCRDLVQYIRAHRPRDTADAGTTTTPSLAVDATQTDVTQFPECVAFQQRLAAAVASGLENPFFRVKQGVSGDATTIAGQQVASFTSFDYLGMAREPRVKAAAQQAIADFGVSASASRLVGGNCTIHEQLEWELAEFLGTEAAVVYPSGFGVNESVLGHLFGPSDLILHDELAHASIVQGIRLSRADHRAFPHNDPEFVDRLLGDLRRRYRRVAIAIEGVYSMDGDYADLPCFLEIKRRHGALLYVDEAHSLGVMGPRGRGLCDHYGLDPSEGDFWMGTLSKALGSAGGYIAGRKLLVDYLKYSTPAGVFATALPPASTAAALAAVRVLRDEPPRVSRLRDRSRRFLCAAQAHGWDTGSSEATPIVPIILGNSARCLCVSAHLLRRGVDVQPILFPAVAEDASRLRFFITAEHSPAQIDAAIEALADSLSATDDRRP